MELDVSGAFAPDDLEGSVERRQLGRAFGRLDDKDRLLLTLHHVWGLPVAETAGHLGIPEGTVKSRVHHAMTSLRAAYDAEYGPFTQLSAGTYCLYAEYAWLRTSGWATAGLSLGCYTVTV